MLRYVAGPILLIAGIALGADSVPRVGALDLATKLAREEKHLQAIPLFAQAVREEKALDRQCAARLIYADCLYSAAFRVVDRLGVPGPQQSVSARRISLLKAAVAQLDTAERIAGDPRLVAAIRHRHGLMLEVWGFPLDAYGWYRAALNMDEACLDARVGLLRTRSILVGDGTD